MSHILFTQIGYTVSYLAEFGLSFVFSCPRLETNPPGTNTTWISCVGRDTGASYVARLDSARVPSDCVKDAKCIASWTLPPLICPVGLNAAKGNRGGSGELKGGRE